MFVAVDKDGTEALYPQRPVRVVTMWSLNGSRMKIRGQWYPIKQGTIERYLGRPLSWEDEPVEIDSHKWLEMVNKTVNENNNEMK